MHFIISWFVLSRTLLGVCVSFSLFCILRILSLMLSFMFSPLFRLSLSSEVKRDMGVR